MQPEPGIQLGLDADLKLTSGQSAHAVSHIPNTLDVFDTHFPRFPVVPGVLVVDCLARLAALLLATQTGQLWRLAAIEQARFRHYVRPGDAVTLDVKLLELEAQSAVFEATAAVAGRTVTQLRRLRLVTAG
jgi:3-hydroxyacyl-[acyl-carrier-protein] dehydratase